VYSVERCHSKIQYLLILKQRANERSRLKTKVTFNGENVEMFASISAVFNTSVGRRVVDGDVIYHQRVQLTLVQHCESWIFKSQILKF